MTRGEMMKGGYLKTSPPQHKIDLVDLDGRNTKGIQKKNDPKRPAGPKHKMMKKMEPMGNN